MSDFSNSTEPSRRVRRRILATYGGVGDWGEREKGAEEGRRGEGRGRPRKPEVKPVSLVTTGAALPAARPGCAPGYPSCPLSLSLLCSLFFVAIRDGEWREISSFTIRLHATHRLCFTKSLHSCCLLNLDQSDVYSLQEHMYFTVLVIAL